MDKEDSEEGKEKSYEFAFALLSLWKNPICGTSQVSTGLNWMMKVHSREFKLNLGSEDGFVWKWMKILVKLDFADS